MSQASSNNITITEEDAQREEAFNSLEISEGYVKCQRCGVQQKIVGKLEVSNGKITRLKTRIKNAQASGGDCKRYLAELAEAESAEAEWERLRSLPLYSSKITGYKFYCSPCWELCYREDQQRKREESRKVL